MKHRTKSTGLVPQPGNKQASKDFIAHKWEFEQHNSMVLGIKCNIQQGVAPPTACNMTGPPRAPAGELRCMCAALQTTTTDDDRHQWLLLVWHHICRRASNNRFAYSEKIWAKGNCQEVRKLFEGSTHNRKKVKSFWKWYYQLTST